MALIEKKNKALLEAHMVNGVETDVVVDVGKRAGVEMGGAGVDESWCRCVG